MERMQFVRFLHTEMQLVGNETKMLTRKQTCEVVLCVFVQNNLAHFSQREFLVRPNLGQIQDIVPEFLRLLWGHGLNVDCPRRIIALLDGLEQILNAVIRVGARKFASLRSIESLEALVGTDVQLSVDIFAILVDPLEGVTCVTVHMVVSIGGTAVREEYADLVNRLGVL